MSLKLIQQYHHKVQEIVQYGGSKNETAIRPAFQKLLELYCADKKLELIPELEYKTPFGTTVNPDGTLKDALRQDWGYWESKDKYDLLEEEIQKKLSKGYPTTNILFEDSQIAVLIQNGREVCRASFDDDLSLHSLITAFVNYEPKEVQLDTITTLHGVPPVAWEYQLGNRSTLEWVLEYHKERKPKDPTIREKFDNYHFADYKEQVIDLLQRVCTVSVETMKVVNAMNAETEVLEMDKK